MKKPFFILALLFLMGQADAQSIIVNPDGTHSVVVTHGNVSTMINSNGTTATMVNNGNVSVIVQSNGTHSLVVNNGPTSTIVNSNGTHSLFVNPFYNTGLNGSSVDSPSSSREKIHVRPRHKREPRLKRTRHSRT